jgi:hypothetical protein
VQGHLWMTQADCNDMSHRLDMDQLPISSFDPSTSSEQKSIFQLLYDNDVSFRNYGEVVHFQDLTGKFRPFIDAKYPLWSMEVSDEDKAKELIREWENGIYPSFIFVVLPNDHTYGGSAGKPTPTSMVADNDKAMGMIIDWVSHSEHWADTIIFAMEDDPQTGAGDHVDYHRSVLFVASPWVKRGYHCQAHYSLPSVYRTIEMILGVPHMNRNTATAPPMYDIFTTTPDFTPYGLIEPNIPWELNPEGTKAAELSARYDWSHYDGHEGLGEILWMMRRPGELRPDYAKVLDK